MPLLIAIEASFVTLFVSKRNLQLIIDVFFRSITIHANRDEKKFQRNFKMNDCRTKIIVKLGSITEKKTVTQ